MTLTEHTAKMFNVIQQGSGVQGNCVTIVSMAASPEQQQHHHQQIVVKNEPAVVGGKRPLAAAPPNFTNQSFVDGEMRRRKPGSYGTPPPPQQPASVARRNARERNRVKQVNNGFAALRQHIPAGVLAAFGATESPAARSASGSKKLSKVETLRVAVEYIKSLQSMLEDHEAEMASNNMINAYVENRFYASASPTDPEFSQYPVAIPTPPSSESAASPTPSQSSDLSANSSLHQTTTQMFLHQDVFKYETKGPDDEELLDAIFSWQQTTD